MAGDLGFINVTGLTDFRGNTIRLDYEWEGPPVAQISKEIAYELMGNAAIEVGDVIQIGPYKVKVIWNDFAYNRFTVVKTVYPFWRLVYLWHRYGRSLDLVYRRFIVTLAVWQLAEYNGAVIPHWSDIYLIKRIRAWFGK